MGPPWGVDLTTHCTMSSTTELHLAPHYMDYSFRLAARVLLYAPQFGTLAGMTNSSMGPPWGVDPTTHCTMSSTTELHLAPHYMDYSFRLAARVLLYAPQFGTLAGMTNSSMGPPWGVDPTTHCTMSGCSTTKLHLAPHYMDYSFRLAARVLLYAPQFGTLAGMTNSSMGPPWGVDPTTHCTMSSTTELHLATHYMDYSFRLAARVLLYAPQFGTLAGMTNSSMGPPWGVDPTTHCTMSSTTELHLAPHYMDYSFRLAASVHLYAPQFGALAGMTNSSMGPPWGIDPTTHCTTWKTVVLTDGVQQLLVDVEGDQWYGKQSEVQLQSTRDCVDVVVFAGTYNSIFNIYKHKNILLIFIARKALDCWRAMQIGLMSLFF